MTHVIRRHSVQSYIVDNLALNLLAEEGAKFHIRNANRRRHRWMGEYVILTRTKTLRHLILAATLAR